MALNVLADVPDDDEIAVFFYGLFMDHSILRDRGITPLRSEIGCIDGYRLRIGARATLVRAAGLGLRDSCLQSIRAEADPLQSSSD